MLAMNPRNCACAIALVLVAASLVFAALPRNRDAESIRKEYQRIKVAQTPHWVDREYQLAGEWATLYLDSHPEATGEALEEWLDALDPAPECQDSSGAPGRARKEPCDRDGRRRAFWDSAVQVASHVYVVAAGFGETFCDECNYQVGYGTFFVVSPNCGKYRVAWHLPNTRDRRLAGPDNSFKTANYHVFKLPASGYGNPRFYLKAINAQGSGIKALGQLSVWEWDGSRAKLLVVRSYDFSIFADKPVIKFDGEYIRVHTQEGYKSFWTYGCDPGPDGEWTIRVKPESVVE
jgi:hypothetical protein